MSKKFRGTLYEILSEVVLITSVIYLSTLFANDVIFNARIQENPKLFSYVAFSGIILAVLLRLLSKKMAEK